MHPIHPMVVHFPIALLSSSVLFDLLATKWNPEQFRSASLYTLLLGLGGALLSVISGHMAEEAVEHTSVPEQALEIHEKLGFATFWIFAGLLGLRVTEWLGWMRGRPVLTIVLGVGAVIVLFVASYYGGSLVYDYGAGVILKR